MPKSDDRLPLQVTPPAARFRDPVAANTVIARGAIVALDAQGNAIPAAPTAPVLRGIGMSRGDNAEGVAGAVSVETSRGAFVVKNNGSIDRTHIGKPVYVVDDETVGPNGTLVAGKCLDVTAAGVAVEFT